MTNKKLVFFGTGILIIILIGTFLVLKKKPADYSQNIGEGLGDYPIWCGDSDNKKYISCQSAKDCTPEKMHEFCEPETAALLKSKDAKYYCGEDGFCFGY